MRLLDFSFDDPADNLALDEVLLNEAEAGRSGETLRFWESPTPFVVLGLTQSVRDHVIEAACAADGVPILRRCSAGGCVLQGPGCLNYALVLRSDTPEFGGIRASYRAILQRIALGLKEIGIEARPAGISDLAIGELKVSGNAQRRRKRFFLHHGTLLYAPNISLYTKYLSEPSDRPEYRKDRTHKEFMTVLQAERSILIKSVSDVFQTDNLSTLTAAEINTVQELARTKYASDAWTYRK